MKQLLLTIVVLLSFSSINNAQVLTPLSLDSTIRYGKLENGLTYYIKHNKKPQERAEFYIAQKVGAILEEDSQNGLAHFLEHMAFNGTKNYPGKKLINYFESIGVKFGANINAYTSLDETVYNLSNVPVTREGIIDSALLVLHDWSSFILLEENEIDKERGVIREEWRQGQNASRRLWKESNKVIMEGSQYSKRDIIGDTAIINNFSYQTLRDYYKKWYRPDLQAVLVVGDIDVNVIERKIKEMFSDIPKPVNPAERTYFAVPDKANPIVGVFTDPEMQTTSISVDFRFDSDSDESKLSVEGYAVTLIRSLINNMTNSRFSEVVQEPGSPFSGISGYLTSVTRTKDAYSFSADPVSGKEKEARERLLIEIEKIARYGFTESELERAKSRIISSYEKSYNERDQQNNNTLVREFARNFLSAESAPGIKWEFEFAKKVLPQMQLDLINKYAKQHINGKSVVYTIYGPEKEGITYPDNNQLLGELENAKRAEINVYKDEITDMPLISEKIKAGKIKKQKAGLLEGTTELVLSNGIKVILKPTKFKDDEIRMSAWSDGGLSLLPIEDVPSAMFTTSVVRQSGLGNFKQTDLNKKLAGKIANVSPGISQYEESLNGISSVKDIETMLQLTWLTFKGPRVDENAYNMVIKSLKTMLENAALDPQNAYSDSINLITMNYHPRVFPVNLHLLDKVNYQTILKVYKERFSNPADFTFMFVGNFDEKNLLPLISKYLGSLKTGKNRENWKDNGLYYAKGKINREIEKKLKINKTTNSIIYTAEVKDDLKTRLLYSTLGNILRIRYTETIREAEGATYGVSVNGGISVKPKPSAIVSMSFSTDPKLSKRMVGIIHSELNTIAEKGPQEEYLSKVRLNLLKQYSENKQENSWWQNAISTKYREGYDLTDGYEKIIESITVDDIKKAASVLVEQNNVSEIILVPSE